MRILLIFLTVILYASIGNIKEIKGDVKILRAQKMLKAYLNMPLEKMDTVYTYKNSKVKIVFKDKTIITIGKNSVFKIKDYFFGKKPKAKFNFLKGTFISVTGKIGKIAPKRFHLQTKNASIGIRGTTVFGEVLPKKDIIGCSQGLISVAKNGQEILVKPGQMVNVFANKITPPIRVPKTYLKKVFKKLSLNKKEIKTFFGNVYTPKEEKKVKNKKEKSKNNNSSKKTEKKKSVKKINTKKTEKIKQSKSEIKTSQTSKNIQKTTSSEIKTPQPVKTENIENSLNWNNYTPENVDAKTENAVTKQNMAINDETGQSAETEITQVNGNNDEFKIEYEKTKINSQATSTQAQSVDKNPATNELPQNTLPPKTPEIDDVITPPNAPDSGLNLNILPPQAPDIGEGYTPPKLQVTPKNELQNATPPTIPQINISR